MAKVVGLVGAASGKIGNVVYAVTNGIQVARVYQPQVYNPKSPLQSQQRAKGNLAGRMSSFVPSTAIMGLGSNNRARRGEWLRNILKNSVVTTDVNGYKAAINAPDVVFSKGDVYLSVWGQGVTAQTLNLSVSLEGIPSAEDYESKQTRLVVMIYDGVTKDLIGVTTKIANKPPQGSNLSTSFPIAHTSGYYADVYAIPMSTADGSAVSISTGLAEKDDATIAALLSVNGNAIVFNYGRSVLLGSASYLPTQAKEEDSENKSAKTSKK